MPIPRLESWSLAQLQAGVKRYGFRASRSRDTMIEQLRAVYQVFETRGVPYDPPHPDPDPDPDADADSDQIAPEPNSGPTLLEPNPAHFAQAIRSSIPLWTRILRYEPVPFDEVLSTIHRYRIQLDKTDTLRAWLDAQSICFYTPD